MTSVVAHNVKLRRVFLLVVEFILRFDTPFGKKIGPNLNTSIYELRENTEKTPLIKDTLGPRRFVLITEPLICPDTSVHSE